jgi:HSP20 family protein
MTAKTDAAQTTDGKPQQRGQMADEKPQQRGPMAEMMHDLAHDLTRPRVDTWPLMPYTPAGMPLQIGAHEGSWAPRTDVFEEDGELVVRAELPGVKKEDLHISLERGTLTIGGERQGGREIKTHDYYIREGTFGSFERRLALRFPVEASQVKAAFADGVLELRLPLPSREKPQPQAIPIS